jgi:hypothetical protein
VFAFDFTADLDTGVDGLTAAIEREPAVAYVPRWWRPVAALMRVAPIGLIGRATK